MVFVHVDEVNAVEELAERVDCESCIYEGWTKFDLLHPKWFKGETAPPPSRINPEAKAAILYRH